MATRGRKPSAGVLVTARVPSEVAEMLNEQRWERRKETLPEAIGDILVDWAKGNGFVPAENAPETLPIEDAPNPPARKK